jgi:hypothetical protein
MYVVLPQFSFRDNKLYRYTKYPRMGDGFCYRSDRNDRWLTVEEIGRLIEGLRFE